MPFFKKLPVVIEAVKLEKGMDLPDWLIDKCKVSGINPITRDIPRGEIETLEGLMIAEAGDWIIRGVCGEVYPCKPHIFESTYEKC